MSQKSRPATTGSIRSKSSTRLGVKKGGNAIIGNEERFKWQQPVNEFDAFYKLPSALSKTATGFGLSTRANWEHMVCNKKDTMNPNAGPGQHDTQDLDKLSTNRSPSKYVFGQGLRSATQKPDTPGPKYDVGGMYKNGNSKSSLRIAFKRSERELSGSDVHAMMTPPVKGYILPLPKGSSKTIGTKLKNPSSAANRSPGPVYNMSKYDFRSGPSSSFSKSKTTRFKYKKPE